MSAIPSISPVLFYADLAVAAAWLEEAFAFTERRDERVVGDDGSVLHAELSFGDGMVILSTTYPPFAIPEEGKAPQQCLYVSVDDARDHLARARSAGALITSELRDTDYGARVYGAQDPGGHHWIFAETLSA